jgi:lipoate-protein ligase A
LAPELENDDLLAAFAATAAPQLRVYEPMQRVVVVGAGRTATRDVDLAASRAAGIPVRTRRGGGGTVLLTPGQVVIALVVEVDHPFHNREYARRINGWIAAPLGHLGVTGIEQRGISDLAIDDRKILGTSIFRRRAILFYQASLLVANNVEEFEQVLRMPGIVPDYRQGRSHKDFCTTLQATGFGGRTAEVAVELHTYLEERIDSLH